MMIVEEIMNPQPVSIASVRTLDEAINLMRDHEVEGLPVVEKGEYIGLLSLNRVYAVLIPMVQSMAEQGKIKDFLAQTVATYMDAAARTVLPETNLVSLIDIFLESGANLLPVVEEGNNSLWGIVGRRELVQATRILFDD